MGSTLSRTTVMLATSPFLTPTHRERVKKSIVILSMQVYPFNYSSSVLHFGQGLCVAHVVSAGRGDVPLWAVVGDHHFELL